MDESRCNTLRAFISTYGIKYQLKSSRRDGKSLEKERRDHCSWFLRQVSQQQAIADNWSDVEWEAELRWHRIG